MRRQAPNQRIYGGRYAPGSSLRQERPSAEWAARSHIRGTIGALGAALRATEGVTPA